jgi:hypothetical protein
LIDLAESAPSRPAAAASPDLLHVCASCAGSLVHPLRWEEEGPMHWRMILRCPECETVREGVFSQRVVHAFAAELNRGEEILLDALKQVSRESMSDALELLLRALKADAIFPSDFGV